METVRLGTELKHLTKILLQTKFLYLIGVSWPLYPSFLSVGPPLSSTINTSATTSIFILFPKSGPHLMSASTLEASDTPLTMSFVVKLSPPNPVFIYCIPPSSISVNSQQLRSQYITSKTKLISRKIAQNF